MIYKTEVKLYNKNPEGRRDRAYGIEKELVFFDDCFDDCIHTRRTYIELGYEVKSYKCEGWFYIG